MKEASQGKEGFSENLRLHRGKYNLSEEAVLELQRDVFKQKDADQETLGKILEVLGKLVQEKGNKESRESVPVENRIRDIFAE